MTTPTWLPSTTSAITCTTKKATTTKTSTTKRTATDTKPTANTLSNFPTVVSNVLCTKLMVTLVSSLMSLMKERPNTTLTSPPPLPLTNPLPHPLSTSPLLLSTSLLPLFTSLLPSSISPPLNPPPSLLTLPLTQESALY